MTEVQLNFLNLNTFFLIGLIILIGGYLYYEIYKIKTVLNDYDHKLYQYKNSLENLLVNDINTEDTINNSDYITTDDITIVENEKITKDKNDEINDEINDEKNDEINDEINDEDEWNEINDLMEENNDNDNNLETLNVSDNDSAKLENDNLDELINEINDNETHKPDYNNMTVSQLKNILVNMKLPVSGNKTKLIERINNNK